MINKFLLALLLFMVGITVSSLTLAQSDVDGRRTVKLSPQVRIIEREHRIPIMPAAVIQQLLNRPVLITEEEIEYAGNIIANANESLLSTKGDKIYVSGLDDGSYGSQYIIVRLGQTYRSPLEDYDNEVLAYEAIYLGEAVVKIPGELATLNITKAHREVRLGDRLLPKPDERTFFEDYHAQSPESLQDGYIIAVVDGTLLIGQHQIVIINKGLDDGMARGHILAVNKKGRRTFDPLYEEEIRLPKLHAGTLLVFRVFDRVSYALIISANLTINVLDEVTVP